ncbi:TetR/AcrR family transcriptional regulator [Mycobacterium sp. SP-6446]|uniref:TetR/AcrR family transcriptional regulator n=1 Tax=Mycobacterium sp. SP-6446 TaxID=1834162 RepID=UPI00096CC427|nr:TetR/AcrR family transcriptional regulator [Mycobacterium sp. SP-6446]OMC16623.1 TetR family transcriptional regulator [Mycobacterium sp. SP-6446]
MKTAPPQLGRPTGADGAQTRARILVAAMRCVAEVGYSRATIREIARAAEMTSGSLYHYFSNKSELLAATVAEIDEVASPRLRAAAARADDVVDRIEAVLDESERLMREYPYLAGFDRAMRAQRAPRSGRTSYSGLKALRDTINEIIEDALTRKALPAGTDPSAAVNAIYALTRGLTERAASLTPEDYAATVDSAKKLIRGTLFGPQARRPKSTGRRRTARGP